MRQNSYCQFMYDDPNITEFINNAIQKNCVISLINDKDPFDFIQSFGKEFYDFKNKHAWFTTVLKYSSGFPLYFLPLNETELIIKVTLSNDNEMSIPYFIYINPYSEMSKYNNENNNNLEWNYSTNGFKCRVDEKKKYNVFYQNTFLFKEEQNIKEIVYNCTKLFHENDYKIIGIESGNEGGMGTIGIYLEQLLQPKICTNKMLFSLRKNDFLKDNFDFVKNNYLEFQTCKAPESIDKLFSKKPDYYDKISHNRN